MKILIDMNLSPKFTDLLIKKGADAVHWIEIGALDAEDSEIMEYARENNHIIMTCDLDFNIILSVTHNLKPSNYTVAYAKNQHRRRWGMDCFGNNAKCGAIRKGSNIERRR